MATIGKWRDTMAFFAEYGYIDQSVIVRLYCTNKRGVYGYQFRCIIFRHGHDAVASSLTNGCGYDKVGAAVSEAMYLAKLPNSAVQLAESGQIREAM